MHHPTLFHSLSLLTLTLTLSLFPSPTLSQSACAPLPPPIPTCTPASLYASSNGTQDDTPAILSALRNCSSNGVVHFPPGTNYLLKTPLSIKNLSNVTLLLESNLHLPQNITYIQGLVNATNNATYSSALYWITLSGPQIHWQGTKNVSGGWVYSYGQAWWDANVVNGTGTPARPHLLSFNTTNGSLVGFKSYKPIAWNVQLIGSNITVRDTIIDAYSASGSFPFNTDGFDVTGTQIHISDSIIYNGDDSIAVQSGSHNVLFEKATIGYQTHGMSIGSLGQDQTSFANVSNITFRDVSVINGVYAARFKSWVGGQGLAQNISWRHIRAYNVTYPIFVTQTYYNQGSTQTQLENGAVVGRPNNASVNMKDFTWEDFRGSINTFRPGDGSCVSSPCWYDVGLEGTLVANASVRRGTEAVVIECNTNSSCTNFQVKDVELWPQDGTPPTVVCINATAELNPGLGFGCANGTFVPTS